MAGNLSPYLPWDQAKTKWAATLNAVLNNPLLYGNFITTSVKTGANTIDHGLGRNLQGYIVTLNDSAVTFHDSQASNQYPQLNLILNASGNANITLYVF